MVSQRNSELGTEWIFCRETNGSYSGLNPNTQVIEKIPKEIMVNGRTVKGWMVKIIQEKSEGHIGLNLSILSNE